MLSQNRRAMVSVLQERLQAGPFAVTLAAKNVLVGMVLLLVARGHRKATSDAR